MWINSWIWKFAQDRSSWLADDDDDDYLETDTHNDEQTIIFWERTEELHC